MLSIEVAGNGHAKLNTAASIGSLNDTERTSLGVVVIDGSGEAS
jgi:hypothetical protein